MNDDKEDFLLLAFAAIIFGLSIKRRVFFCYGKREGVIFVSNGHLKKARVAISKWDVCTRQKKGWEKWGASKNDLLPGHLRIEPTFFLAIVKKVFLYF